MRSAGVPARDDLGDPARDDAGLSGPGAGEDEQRSLDAADGLSLLVVQSSKMIGHRERGDGSDGHPRRSIMQVAMSFPLRSSARRGTSSGPAADPRPSTPAEIASTCGRRFPASPRRSRSAAPRATPARRGSARPSCAASGRTGARPSPSRSPARTSATARAASTRAARATASPATSSSSATASVSTSRGRTPAATSPRAPTRVLWLLVKPSSIRAGVLAALAEVPAGFVLVAEGNSFRDYASADVDAHGAERERRAQGERRATSSTASTRCVTAPDRTARRAPPALRAGPGRRSTPRFP